jgi:hypothetical protein
MAQMGANVHAVRREGTSSTLCCYVLIRLYRILVVYVPARALVDKPLENSIKEN